MKITISPYEPEDILSVKRFNQRLNDANEHYLFPENNISKKFPKTQNPTLYQEYFLAKDDEGEVRGGYSFINQEFNINNQLIEVSFLKLPLSEGIINKKYINTGALIIEDVQKRKELIFALGMGGFENPLPKMLKRIGWSMYTVPFYFYIINQNKFLNEFEYLKALKKSFLKNLILTIIKYVGGLYFLKMLIFLYTTCYRMLNFKKFNNIKIEVFFFFLLFADELWVQNKNYYSFSAKRDSEALNILYPKEMSKFSKLKIIKNGTCIGWVVLIITKMEHDKFFGNLRLATIVDAFSKPIYSDIVIYESVKYCIKNNADLIVSNNSNINWGKQYFNNGFIKGPSNFILALSKKFKRLFNNQVDFENSFIMRGDGDGPINL